ncbi:thiol reductant ABC exporter subunit CydD [Amycolatopsis suaedae]|uniref:Thiol reductant ABC exporter subunit CydD n=1 Tax=Amycolatopsis suaedae TaxID=2510978 RepID=A0A4Q7JDN2_9PSEU|nr:thiol reductant ABC exporter subunit CydD [Amycolatopsis suaedae]RZQ65579.1 thiol reductant ABC exporter subunit CydD [Amycolatopsis suaedae]
MRPVDPRLAGELPGLRRYLAVLAVLGTATAAAILVQAEFLAGLLAHAAGQPAPGTLGTAVALLACAVAGRAALTWAGGLLGDRFAARARTTLRATVLARVRPGADPGRTATLVTRGVDGVRAYLADYLPRLVASVVVPLAVLARLAVADLTAALTIAVTLPLVPVFAALVGAHTRDRNRRQWRLLSTVGGHFLDMVAGLPTLKAFGRARAQAAVVRRMADAHAGATVRTLRVAFLSALVLELVATLSVALVAVPVGLRLLDGGVSAHTALLVLVLAPEAYLPLRAAGAAFHAAAEGLAVLEEIRSLPPSPVAGTREPGPVGEIRLERVTVWHPGRDRPALSEVDLVVRAGERIALTGPSGAGKSTLLAVLLGFVPPSSGRVLVDGVDLRELDPDAWRRKLAWVPQRPTLFAGTLRDNVTLGLAGTVTGVAGLAGDRAVGEHGAGLSAGQAQRVGLARALRRPRAEVLLLDEPTAHLDTATEAEFLRTARTLARDRTVVLVAHRPVMTELATRVVRLRAGVLEEPCHAGG